jgi:hypothetical protein
MQQGEKTRPANDEAGEVEGLTQELAAPFDPREVRFKPAVVSGNRALALAYVDARAIQDRLDDVVGVEGWQDEYECLPDGSVVCKLHVRLGGEWVTKTDVGGQSEQPDEGDRRKAAFSDALKRAAVKFGIGRYLYRLPQQWCDYDPHKRQFARTPTLPAWALPGPAVKELTPRPAPKGGARKPEKEAPVAEAAQARAEKAAGPARRARGAVALPANGAELQRRLYDKDALLAKQGVCQPGELVKHVVAAGVKAGFEADLAAWSGPAIILAVEETKAFEAQKRPPAAEKKEVA